MTGTKVSIILPVYNAEKSIRNTLDSALAQTLRDFELIVIDDCSTDRSMEIVGGYARQDPRIYVLQNSENHGVAYCRNWGIREAAGKYVAFLDSDDIWAEDKLERQVSLLERTGAQLTCASYDFIDEDGRSILRPHLVPEKIDFYSILRENIILVSTVCADAALLKEHPFQSKYYHEDLVLWLDLLRIPIRVVTDAAVVTHYRLIRGSRSHNKIHAAKQRWRIYREHLEMDLFRCCFYFVCYTLNGIKKYYR